MNNDAICRVLSELAGGGTPEISHEEAEAHRHYLESLNTRINECLTREQRNMETIDSLLMTAKCLNKAVRKLLR